MIRNSVIRNVGHAREGRVITSIILQLTIAGLLIGMLAWMGLAAAATAQQKSVGSAAPVTPPSGTSPQVSASLPACKDPGQCFINDQVKANWAAQNHCTFCAITADEVYVVLPKASSSTVQSIANALNGHLVAYGLDNYTRLTEFFAQATVETGEGTNFTESLNYSVQGLLSIFPKYFKKHPADACEYGRISPKSKKTADKKSVTFCKALAKKEKKKKGGYVYKSHAADWEAIANRAYAGKNKNGSVSSGDGWKYRGRGMFMLTEKGNYESFQNWYNSIFSAKSHQDFISDPNLLMEPDYAVTSAAYFWLQHGLAITADEVSAGSSPCDVANKITSVVDKHTDSYNRRCQWAKKIFKAGLFNRVDCTLPPSNGKPVTGLNAIDILDASSILESGGTALMKVVPLDSMASIKLTLPSTRGVTATVAFLSFKMRGGIEGLA